MSAEQRSSCSFGLAGLGSGIKEARVFFSPPVVLGFGIRVLINQMTLCHLGTDPRPREIQRGAKLNKEEKMKEFFHRPQSFALTRAAGIFPAYLFDFNFILRSPEVNMHSLNRGQSSF